LSAAGPALGPPPSPDSLRSVLDRIDEDEVVELALELARIDSPTGAEEEVGRAIEGWLRANGFDPRRVGLLPERANIAARVRGAGGGPSLMLNSHMDTSIAADDLLTTPNAADAIYHTAWREGDRLLGNGVVNNKGMMATWMIAAKAVREAGIELAGDLLMTMVVGEISIEPVDEFTGPEHVSKDIGARFLVARGYTADYAIVAEGTGFALNWVEAGKLFLKVRVLGADPPVYTPYVPKPDRLSDAPSAIVRASEVIAALERWSAGYERENTWRGPGGVVVPKVSINAIRGGLPHKVTKTPAVCDLYLDVRLNPDQRPAAVEREVAAVVAETGIPAVVEPFMYRRGHQATGVEPIVEAIEGAHRHVLDDGPAEPMVPHTSMWRDSNVFIEAGIPTVIYGPGASTAGGKFAIDIEALVAAARIYAAIILRVCGEAPVSAP
jgi:acetylornithine deacetylase/succinyl-diaminopimelate desuccinylase-like protein